MVAAVSKIMRVQDLILVAQKVRVVTRFRNSIGLAGRMSTRLQPNHPRRRRRHRREHSRRPALRQRRRGDRHQPGHRQHRRHLRAAEDARRGDQSLRDPDPGCILTHVTTSIEAINRGAPLDLVFQSIAGTEAANASFGISLARCRKATRPVCRRSAAPSATTSCISRPARAARSRPTPTRRRPADLRARAYAVARRYKPLLVNTVVGFIGPEYLYNGKQIIRAGLEDHFCGKLLGVPMGCDICYTNHAEADQTTWTCC